MTSLNLTDLTVAGLRLKAIEIHRWLYYHSDQGGGKDRKGRAYDPEKFALNLKGYETIVDEIKSRGATEVPEVVSRDPDDRFMFPNKTYVLTLNNNDSKIYHDWKWTEGIEGNNDI